MEAEPILSEAENLSIAQKYVAWRLGGGKEKYTANAKRQNAKKKEGSIKSQIAKCKLKLEGLLLKEAQRALLTPPLVQSENLATV
jgi:hypothetical protein